jgi:hypothetical protein
MKSLPIHLNRLDKALQAQGVVFKRHQILEVCAAAFGYRSSNECTAAAKKGDLTPPPAPATGRFRLDDGQSLVLLLDPVANAPFAVDETFLEDQDEGKGALYGVSPYGHLLDLTSSVTDKLQTLADAAGYLDPEREIEFTIYTATIDHRHGSSVFTSLTQEGIQAEIEGWCDDYWHEVSHRFPEGTELEGQELVDAYFDDNNREFLSQSESTIHLTVKDILAVIAKEPKMERRAPAPATVDAVTPTPPAVDYWADHPVYGSEDWRYEVSNGDTRQSYAEWVASKIEQEGQEDEGPVPVRPWTTDYPNGHSDLLYLTSGCCEAANGGPALFAHYGLKHGLDAFGYFYPLTDDERRYIGEDELCLPNGFHASTAYSFLYEGRKFTGAAIEVMFGKGFTHTRDSALAAVTAYAHHITGTIDKLGGHVLYNPDNGPEGDRHTIEILIPFNKAQELAGDFETWKCELAKLIMPADGPRVIARFIPQAWQNDYAIEVDAQGPDTWDVTHQIVSISKKSALAIVDDDYASDNFHLSTAAPKWVRDWQGPFRVELEEQISSYFDQIDNC